MSGDLSWTNGSDGETRIAVKQGKVEIRVAGMFTPDQARQLLEVVLTAAEKIELDSGEFL